MDFIFQIKAGKRRPLPEFFSAEIAQNLQDIMTGSSAGMDSERVQMQFLHFCEPVDAVKILRSDDNTFFHADISFPVIDFSGRHYTVKKEFRE